MPRSPTPPMTSPDALVAVGVERGDRVGVRIPSGTTDLYIAILGILAAGCAYVLVDHDDPDERARVVFGEAGVAAVVTADLVVRGHRRHHPGFRSAGGPPDLTDDAWIIFTSGSTGTPKGVAVTHRNAAAFVDAESLMFLQAAPIRPGDRVMAGLSVAFDASCEEMWLAWRYGACLVPAPAHWCAPVSTSVRGPSPTDHHRVDRADPRAALAARCPAPGGSACSSSAARPARLRSGARLATPEREVWNTYGPTEATVVACRRHALTGEPPVRIGLPLAGWDRPSWTSPGSRCPMVGGGLIIGGVGLARYLDPDRTPWRRRDATLGWDAPYRSGDRVRFDGVGIIFAGRRDEQVKVGGRTDRARRTRLAPSPRPARGHRWGPRSAPPPATLLIGYVTVDPSSFDAKASVEQLRRDLPAPLVPKLAVVEAIPVPDERQDRRPALAAAERCPGGGRGGVAAAYEGRRVHRRTLGGGAGHRADLERDFDVGGDSLAAAELISRLRANGSQSDRRRHLRDADPGHARPGARCHVHPAGSPQPRCRHRALQDPARPGGRHDRQPLGRCAALAGWIGLGNALAHEVIGLQWLPRAPWWLLTLGVLLLLTPTRADGAGGTQRPPSPARCRGRRRAAAGPPQGLARRAIADELGATNLRRRPGQAYARGLGARIGADVDLHSLPPVTGMLDLGPGTSIEPEGRPAWPLDRRCHFILGPIRVRAGACRIALDAPAEGRRRQACRDRPGQRFFGNVPADGPGRGAGDAPIGTARGPWADEAPPAVPPG